MPTEPAEPIPPLFPESRRVAPELAQEASYLAASAKISNFRLNSTMCKYEHYCERQVQNLFTLAEWFI